MASLAHRPWVPDDCEALVQSLARATAARSPAGNRAELARLVACNAQIHDTLCLNLNPAANVMNPKAEALLAAGLGSRPSLGYPGGKYEMGLEAIEAIEVIAAELAAEVFGARHAEIRVGSGALANLYVFMATCRPGDRIIAPAGRDRRPRHPPRRWCGRALRPGDPRGPGRCRPASPSTRPPPRRRPAPPPAADHHRRQPQSRTASR
jgi:hypothetical protein